MTDEEQQPEHPLATVLDWVLLFIAVFPIVAGLVIVARML